MPLRTKAGPPLAERARHDRTPSLLILSSRRPILGASTAPHRRQLPAQKLRGQGAPRHAAAGSAPSSSFPSPPLASPSPFPPASLSSGAAPSCSALFLDLVSPHMPVCRVLSSARVALHILYITHYSAALSQVHLHFPAAAIPVHTPPLRSLRPRFPLLLYIARVRGSAC